MEEATVALALFLALHGEKPPRARRYLGATQGEALAGACDWVDANAELVECLRDSPSTLVRSAFPLEPVRGVFGSWFHRRKRMSGSPPIPTPTLAMEKRRHLEEARALVDEVLGPPASR